MQGNKMKLSLQHHTHQFIKQETCHPQ